MSKIFVIPDIHLKHWMIKEAESHIEQDEYDGIVFLGDLVDDWGKELDIDLYNETFDVMIAFCKKYHDTLPLDIRYVIGNHDISYIWNKMESGYSIYAYAMVNKRTLDLLEVLPRENRAFIHRIDNVLFSHGGLSEHFVLQHFGSMRGVLIDDMISQINNMGPRELWHDESPLWLRPQGRKMRMYPWDMLQVVGHTPVERITLEGRVLSTDVFSTCRNGESMGEKKFVWIDTETMEYHAIG